MRIRRRLYVFAALLGAIGVAGAALGSVPLVSVALTASGLLGLYGWLVGRSAREVQLNNLAFERLTRGQIDEAAAILSLVPPERDSGYVGRALALQRAMIALQRGDAARAVVLTTRTIEGKPGLLTRQYEDIQIVAGLALRSLARASLGQDDGAHEDAAFVDRSPNATPEAVARVALARAVVLARKKELAALGTHFSTPGGALTEWLVPRERALARALRHMARARPTSVYREPGRREEATEEGRIAAWIAKVAPEAAVFAPEAASHAASLPAPITEAATPDARREVERSRTAARKASNKYGRPVKLTLKFTVTLWATLVGLFFAIFMVLPNSTPHYPSVAPGSVDGLFLALCLLFIAALVGAFAFQMRRVRSFTRRLVAARLLAARGEEEAARAELIALSAARLDSISATAHLILAQLAERRADWPAVVAACDQGIARASRRSVVRAANSDILIPELVGLRALGLAALQRHDEAAAELATLAGEFPTFVHAARAHFRARLVSAVVRGDLDSATKVAAGRTLDLPLTIRDDMLADLVLTTTRGGSEKEIERIDAELREDDSLATWIDRIAPELRRRPRVRISNDGGNGSTSTNGDAGRAERLPELADEEAHSAVLEPVGRMRSLPT
jgi:hypothetical protein